MELVEALVLSELLLAPTARRVLLRPDADDSSEGSDQRREISLDVLATRVDTRAAQLRPDLDAAQGRAEQLLTQLDGGGYHGIPFGGSGYPTCLASIADPPPVLWLEGRPNVLLRPGVALVGSRAGSPYAREVAEYLGSELSHRGVTVISGLARGVDGAAHRGGLRGAGSTVAVLGCGVDVVYPREHAALARHIASSGALLSELPPSVPPLSFHFPRRNRIISGLSAAVVVVEATERSGSLITARCAAEQGREVMAVPGSVLAGRNRGGHALIKDGAKVVETVDDILEEIGFDPGPGLATDLGLTEPDLLLRHMDTGESYDLDALTLMTGLDSPKLLSRLVELELEGRVQRLESGRFSRLRG